MQITPQTAALVTTSLSLGLLSPQYSPFAALLLESQDGNIRGGSGWPSIFSHYGGVCVVLRVSFESGSAGAQKAHLPQTGKLTVLCSHPYFVVRFLGLLG